MYKFFFLLLLFCMIFTDLPIFPNNTVTHSFMFIMSPMIFLLLFILNRFGLKLKIDSFIYIFFIYMLLSLISSLILLNYVLMVKGDFIAYNKNLLIKTLESFFSLTFLHFTVAYNLNFLIQRISIKFLKRIILFVFLFLTLSGAIEFFNPSLIDLFHIIPKEYNRLRLFNMEPSHAALIYFVFSTMAIFLIRNKIFKGIMLFISFVIFILIGSKGFFITLILASFLMFIKNMKDIKIYPLFIVILATLFFIFNNLILPSLLIDIEKFTSFSTRFSGILSTFLILILMPLGTGYGTYLYFYPDILEKSYSIANQIFLSLFSIPLSSLEVDSIVSTGQNLGAKASLPQIIMFNGWIGLLFFVFLLVKSKKTIKKLSLSRYNKLFLEFIVYVVFIQLIIGSEYNLLYCIWLPLVFIEKLNKQEVVKYETKTSLYSFPKPLSAN